MAKSKIEWRFWSYVIIGGEQECWLWTAGLFSNGYGQFRLGKRKVRAHRYAFFLTFGHWPQPNGLHRCDNPRCCNPAHIYEGTDADNSRDRGERGRTAKQCGSRNGSAKLTLLQVRRIQNSQLTQKQLAQQFSIHPNHVGRIRRGERWADATK